MRTLENKIPPLVVVLVFGAAMWFSTLYGPIINIPPAIRIPVIAAIALVGAILCFLGVAEFGKSETTVNPLQPEKASSLVKTGIYQYTRNPMYLGFLLFLLAWAVYLSTPLAVLGVAGYVLYMSRFQIQPEERVLENIFGKEFEAYKLKVRRWV